MLHGQCKINFNMVLKKENETPERRQDLLEKQMIQGTEEGLERGTAGEINKFIAKYIEMEKT